MNTDLTNPQLVLIYIMIVVTALGLVYFAVEFAKRFIKVEDIDTPDEILEPQEKPKRSVFWTLDETKVVAFMFLHSESDEEDTELVADYFGRSNSSVQRKVRRLREYKEGTNPASKLEREAFTFMNNLDETEAFAEAFVILKRITG